MSQPTSAAATSGGASQPPRVTNGNVSNGLATAALVEDYGRPVDLIAYDGEQVEIDLDDIALSGSNVALNVLLQIKARAPSWLIIAQEHLRQGRLGMAQETLRVAIQELEKMQDVSGLIDVNTMQGHIALLQARSAPKLILREGMVKQDKLPATTLKARDFFLAAGNSFQKADELVRRTLGQGGRGLEQKAALLLGKAMLFTSNRNFAEAENQLNILSRSQPDNVLGLMCQGRLFLQTKRPDLALKAYQRVLQLQPEFSPDPRVGLGLAYWLAGDGMRAKYAWNRALKRNANCVGASFLLTLATTNDSKNPNAKLSAAQRSEIQVNATKTMAKLFGVTEQKLAPVALSLIRNAELQGQIGRAIKLAERAIQYADTTAHTRRGISERTRLAYVAGEARDVEEYTKMARADQIPDPVVEIIAAQSAIKAGNYREALNVIELAAKKLGTNAPLEMNLTYALLLAYPHPGMTPHELAVNVKIARDILNQLHEMLKSAWTNKTELDARLRGIAEDPLIFVQLAKLWQSDNLDKAIDAYRTAIEIRTRQAGAEGSSTRDLTGLKMSNNLATLYMMQGNVDGATQLYEQVIGTLGDVKEEEDKMLQATLLYNLGRAYEESEDFGRATEAYRGLLSKHPEYTSAKIRLSRIAMDSGRIMDADALLKEANVSNPHDPVLRAYVASHLARQEKWDEVAKYAQATRKQHPDDVHALSTLGAFHYHIARESKGSEAERRKDFCRSAEAFSQALLVDPSCTVAAQGLAISIAEEHLPSNKNLANGSTDANSARLRSYDVALSIFNRIKDSLPGSTVLVNAAHAHFARGEEERAVESYLAASAIHEDTDVPILLYLTRAYYQLANKTNSYPAMSKAVIYCQKALHLKPSDKAILYNLAMIQQKAAELVLGLDPSKRTLTEVRQVIGQAEHSTMIFRTLADLRDRPLPYDSDLADQRSKYGESLQRRGGEQLMQQQEYEADIEGKHSVAKEARDAERKRQAMMDEEARKERELQAIKQAELRKEQREEAQRFRDKLKREYEEEEQKTRAKKERKDDIIVSGDEGTMERKPRRKSKKKVKEDFIEDDQMDVDGDEGAAQMTDDEEEEGRERSTSRVSSNAANLILYVQVANGQSYCLSTSQAPRDAKKKKKRPAVIDPDGDDAEVPDRPLKKSKFKSAAMIDDSDEEE